MKNTFYLFLSLVLLGCATEEELTQSYLNPNLSYGSVTDCSGNTYATIEIGSQVWMAENLRTTCYQNGDPIPNVTNENNWYALSTGAWAYYNNDSQYEIPYGKLYNGYTVSDPRNLCPIGWHVPSDAEWNILIGHLDSAFDPDAWVGYPQSNIAGAKMKSIGHQYWYSSNDDATNESGFSGLPSSLRQENGSFSIHSRSEGRWWSSSEFNSTLLLLIWRSLVYYDGAVRRNYKAKKAGYSVRCVKD